MKLIFIVSNTYYKTKMSRVRFQSIEAIGKHPKMDLTITGPGFDNWDNTLDCQSNIDNLGLEPDLVLGFKPLELKGFEKVKAPTCIRYNEMYDKPWTIKELTKSQSNLVICHHYNDFVEYKEMLSKVKAPYRLELDWIPHSAEASIYKPMPEIAKAFDVVILGAVHVNTLMGSHYPLRARMHDLLKRMPSKYRCATIPHVGGNFNDAYTNKYAFDFAKKINSAKIVVTDSGAPKSRFGKYQEIPMCGTAIAGDVYDDHPEDVKKLKEFLIEINMSMTDKEIISKLVYYLENKKERMEKVEKGLEYCKNYTHEKYAERFYDIAKKFLKGEK